MSACPPTAARKRTCRTSEKGQQQKSRAKIRFQLRDAGWCELLALLRVAVNVWTRGGVTMPIQQHHNRLLMFGGLAASAVQLILLGLAINIAGCRPGNAQATAPPKRLGILMGGSSCPSPDGPTFWKPLLQNLA